MASRYLVDRWNSFFIVGTVNLQNCRIWAKGNLHALHSPRVSVWCSLIAFIIVGLFFFQERWAKAGWKICSLLDTALYWKALLDTAARERDTHLLEHNVLSDVHARQGRLQQTLLHRYYSLIKLTSRVREISINITLLCGLWWNPIVRDHV